MLDYRDFLEEELKDDELKKEYDALKPEYEAIQALIEARKLSGITQKELSERTGISQADISRIENGTRNPSVRVLSRLADGLDMDFIVKFIPREMA